MGLYEMIRPEGRPIVPVTWVSVAFTLIMTSLYFSDTKGAIEPVPDGFFDKLTLVTSRLTMIAIAIIVMVMFYEVVARYVFSAPTLWANEMSLWIAAFVFLFAGQYAMQQRSHIRIYVIYDMMPRWAQKTADVISVVLIVFFAFALADAALHKSSELSNGLSLVATPQPFGVAMCSEDGLPIGLGIQPVEARGKAL